MKTAKIYDTCVDTAAIEHRGISPLENLIKRYGDWTVTGGETNSCIYSGRQNGGRSKRLECTHFTFGFR